MKNRNMDNILHGRFKTNWTAIDILSGQVGCLIGMPRSKIRGPLYKTAPLVPHSQTETSLLNSNEGNHIICMCMSKHKKSDLND